MAELKVVHFLNHFFAGKGGETTADSPVEVRQGAIGPGVPLEKHWKGRARIVATVSCGDNYFASHGDEVAARVVEVVRAEGGDFLVAGPAFDAGRYGYACASVCSAASEQGVLALTGMYPENPGVEVYRRQESGRIYLVPTAKTVTGMPEALARLAGVALRAAEGTLAGDPEEEGFLPRGVRTVIQVEKRAARRAVEMVLAKVKSLPIRTETPLGSYPIVPPAKALKRLADSRVAVMSTSGVVPKGNPHRFKTIVNTHWIRYSIENMKDLERGAWETVHGGYNTDFMNRNPNFGVPLDALRALEGDGMFGSLAPHYYAVPGNMAEVSDAHRMGHEMAKDMLKEGVQGVLLVAT